jgi:glucosamine-6-phosphate deaminase
MEVIILPNADIATDLVAQIIARELRRNPRPVLGLATGRTMETVYARLVRLHREEGLDFSACHTFNLDEYVGLPASDVNSYRHYMNQRLFNQVNIDLQNTHLPDGVAADFKAECGGYEALITQCGGIDLQLLGIGNNGHLGFNEPLSAFSSRTCVKILSPVTLRQNAGFFPSLDQMPRRAITMGVGTILDCRRCVLLATGADKASIVAQAVEGPVTSMVTATALQWHPDCAIVLDEAAAGKLKETAYYRWVFANQPEWDFFRALSPAADQNGRSFHPPEPPPEFKFVETV